MEKVGKAIVKLRIPILILSVLLLIPAGIGYVKTKVNYDILYYLPGDIDTMKGQDILMDEFNKGAYATVVVKGMDAKGIEKIEDKIEKLNRSVYNIQYKRKKLLENYLEGVVAKDIYEETDVGYEKKLSEAKAQLSMLEQQYDNEDSLQRRLADFRKALSKNQILEEFDRGIFESIIEKVIVGGYDENGEKDPYKIIFVYKTGFKNEIGNAKERFGKKSKAVEKAKEMCSHIVDEVKDVCSYVSDNTCRKCSKTCEGKPTNRNKGEITIRNFRIVQTEGSRQVTCDTKDYTIKGWVMDDE